MGEGSWVKGPLPAQIETKLATLHRISLWSCASQPQASWQGDAGLARDGPLTGPASLLFVLGAGPSVPGERRGRNGALPRVWESTPQHMLPLPLWLCPKPAHTAQRRTPKLAARPHGPPCSPPRRQDPP